MCRLMHRFWTAQEFAFFQLEGLLTVACGNIKQEHAGFSSSRHTTVYCVTCSVVLLKPQPVLLKIIDEDSRDTEFDVN